MKKPQRLAPGDPVVVVAPAGPVSRESFDAGLAVLADRYDVRHGDGVYASEGFLAGNDRRRRQELEAALADPEVRAIFCARGNSLAIAASICHFLVGVEDFHRFAPMLVDVPHLRIDRLDAITAVSKPFERAFQPTPIDLGFVREAVELVEVIVANRQILGNGPQVVLALLEIPDTRFGRFATGGEEAHNGQNQHGHDNERHNNEQHSGLDADIAKEP